MRRKADTKQLTSLPCGTKNTNTSQPCSSGRSKSAEICKWFTECFVYKARCQVYWLSWMSCMWSQYGTHCIVLLCSPWVTMEDLTWYHMWPIERHKYHWSSVTLKVTSQTCTWSLSKSQTSENSTYKLGYVHSRRRKCTWPTILTATLKIKNFLRLWAVT